MERTEKKWTEALEWLQFVLNPVIEAPKVKDWMALVEFAEKQKITGLCDPTKYDVRVGIDVLSHWIGDVEQIKNASSLLNKRIEELCNILEGAGFCCCILKGQGNAEMYHEPLMRMPGDIDVWIDADKKSIQKFVKDQFPEAAESYKHIKFPVFDDVPVDVHVTPLKFYCPKYNKRLQRWISLNKKEQFEHKIHLTGVGREVCVPTAKFNAVYLLGHMLIHLLDEGLGLRQVVDYFYVLKGLDIFEKEREELVSTVKSLGMYGFAQAIMWVESYVLGLSVERCFVEPDERRGKQLLNDIMESGNFGHYSKRYNGRSGFYYRGLVEAWRVVGFLPIAPREGVAKMVNKLGTAVRHSIKLARAKCTLPNFYDTVVNMRMFLVILLLLSTFNFTVLAQDENIDDSNAIETNSFWDNWYVHAGADMSLLMAYGKDVMDVFPNGKSFGINVGAGKWFTPDFGIRGNIKWENGILKNDHAIWLGKANRDNGGYLVFSGDLLFNMHNLIGEYNPNRKWNLSVYPRMGALINLGTHDGSPVLGIGINNTYRLNDRWRLYGDVTCQVISSALGFQSGQGSGSNGFLDFTVGVQVDLGNNKFQKATVLPSFKEKAIVVNSFWDNWFVQAGLGMSLLNPYGANFSHVFPNGSSFGVILGLGKWFTPEIGLRGSFNWQNGLIGNNDISWIDADDDPGSNHRAGGWGAAYMDVFLNLHNIFGVYDSNRKWNAIVFPRAGLDSNFDLGDISPLVGLGIENTYKLNDRLSLYADVTYQVTTGSFMGKHSTGASSNSNGWFDFAIGVQYELGQVIGWYKPKKVHGEGLTVHGSWLRVNDGHNWPRFIVNTGTSVAVAFGAKTALKAMINEERPDHSDNKSFPSGHASMAFAAARSIDKEFRKDCIWIPIAGYAAATAIGVERVVNDRHHWYDVVAGAGIGIGAAELTWWLSDKLLGKGSNVAVGSSGNTIDVMYNF